MAKYKEEVWEGRGLFIIDNAKFPCSLEALYSPVNEVKKGIEGITYCCQPKGF